MGPSQDLRYALGTSGGVGLSTGLFVGNDDNDDDDDDTDRFISGDDSL